VNALPSLGMGERAIRPRIVAIWVVVLAAGFVATPTAASAHQSASGAAEANRWFWAVVGIVFTVVVGVWLLSLLMVIFGAPIVWIRDRLAEHLEEHPARIKMDHNLR
jgi:hypothetical protein